MKLPRDIAIEYAEATRRMDEIELIVRDCAAVCEEMYKATHPDRPFDFIQGWEAALDLAEQAILKRYGLDK